MRGQQEKSCPDAAVELLNKVRRGVPTVPTLEGDTNILVLPNMIYCHGGHIAFYTKHYKFS